MRKDKKIFNLQPYCLGSRVQDVERRAYPQGKVVIPVTRTGYTLTHQVLFITGWVLNLTNLNEDSKNPMPIFKGGQEGLLNEQECVVSTLLSHRVAPATPIITRLLRPPRPLDPIKHGRFHRKAL